MQGLQIGGGVRPLVVGGLLAADLGEGAGRGAGDEAHCVCENGVGDTGLRLHAEKADIALPLHLIFPEQRPGPRLVVPLGLLERLVGDAARHQRWGGPDQTVAVPDVRVEEAERHAGLHGLHPQGDLGQLDCHRVEVHPIEAEGGDLVQRVAYGIDGRLGVLLPYGRDPLGDAPGGGDQEVAGAAGRVADGEGEELVDDVLGRVGDLLVGCLLLPRLTAASITGSSVESSTVSMRAAGV